ncbi:MlaD family protein [Chryseosolibacter indicus]|uniref:MCE family protein n=1 Tax=Chryseosolibacter indicus TaxID=2782351 RepID=A0ABS5VL95_9BACT|nr:MlaD family protein [Chryseosolibacter indicus]MBT1701768.1 MCE family protein [Chryseosolibacter indicus]
MERKEIAQQVKVGAFVLGGLALFIISVFYVGAENNILTRTFDISAVFKNVEGLKEGDNVWFSGVKVGTVTDVRIMSPGKVVVRLALKNNQHEFISKDATASVGSDGLVGNKIVVIRPGNINNGVVEDGDTINTLSPADTQELINIAKDVGENTRSLTSDLQLIAKRVNDGQGIIGELFKDGALAKDLRDAVASLKKTGDNSVRVSSELNSLLAELRTGDGLLPTLIHDTSYADTFTQALANVREVSKNAEVVAQNLGSLAEKMNNENNALNVLLGDSAFASKLQTTMVNAEQASAKLDQNMEALQHNFLLRGYFRKQEKRKKKEAEAASSASSKGGE